VEDLENLRAVLRQAIREVDQWETLTAYRPFVPPRKEDRACCVSRKDRFGRYPIGWCSPECEGRPLAR
jgi:hypothetical protein